MLNAVALRALNHLLADAPWARERLQPFAGQRARITFSSPLPPLPAVKIAFHINDNGTLDPIPAKSIANEVDVDITLPAGAPLAAFRGRDAFMEGVQVSGSAQFAEALSFVLRNLDWDAEEDLSRIVGDVAAHRLVNGAKNLAAAQKDLGKRATENVVEYLKYEQAPWASKQQAAEFQATNHELALSLAQLEKRLSALE